MGGGQWNIDSLSDRFSIILAYKKSALNVVRQWRTIFTINFEISYKNCQI